MFIYRPINARARPVRYCSNASILYTRGIAVILLNSCNSHLQRGKTSNVSKHRCTAEGYKKPPKKFVGWWQTGDLILPPKMPFFRSSRSAISLKIFTTNPIILSLFCHPKMRPFQQCITVTTVNLFYEVLPIQFEAFGLYISQGEKQVTAEYWVSEQLLLLLGITLWVGRSLIIIF